MNSLLCPDCFGSLTIDGVSLHTAAWCVPDLDDWWQSFDRRGDNPLVPSVPFRSPREQIADETPVVTEMVFGGTHDRTGAPHGLPVYEGLEANLDDFHGLVVDLPGTPAGTRTAVLTKPSGATVSYEVQVVKFKHVTRPGGYALATLRCKIVGT